MASTPVARRHPAAPEPARAARWASGVGRRLGYEFCGFILAVVAFVLVIPFFFAGVGTSIVWIGLPILVLTTLFARSFAHLERAMLRGMLRIDAPTPQHKTPYPGAGWFSRMLTPLRDPQSWLNMAWVFVDFFLKLITFVISVVWFVGALATIAGPVTEIVLRLVLPDDDYSGLGELLGFSGQAALVFDLVSEFLIGLVFLLTLSPVLRGLTGLHRVISHGMLCSRWDAQQELERTRASRSAGRTAESEGLRRLERDLHDGPQQRLIRSSMDLARAERMMGREPERAASLIAEIRGQTNATLAELRQLSRGIAPPLLVDRGLGAALAEIAGNSTIPTSVDCPPGRLPLHVETGIYYVASEALANANKHSRATSIAIRVTVDGHNAAVRISDNGIGGAQNLAGHGLQGLRERVASLEGSLSIGSPVGEGTSVEAVIPCAS